jgi:hypothetical protein
MADMARAMQQPDDVGLSLQALTACATDTIEGADYASISVRHRDGRLETLAPTDPIARRVDLLQFELSEGPCYDAVEASSVTLSEDLARDARWRTGRRWPRWDSGRRWASVLRATTAGVSP